MGVGSAFSSLAAARLPMRFTQRSRLVVFAAALFLLAPLMYVASSPLALGAVALATGLALGPVLIGSFAIAESVTPLAQISTVMSALSTAITVGVAAGSSIAGPVVDRSGAAHSLLLPGAAAALCLVAALVNVGVRRIRR